MKEPLDDFEQAMFDLMAPNARISNRKVAEKLGVTEGAIRHRLKKLIAARSIRVSTVVNPIKVGEPAAVYVRLVVTPSKIEHVVQKLTRIRQIGYIAQVSGSADVTLVMGGESLDMLFRVFSAQIRPISGVRDSKVLVVTRVKKHLAHLAHILD